MRVFRIEREKYLTFTLSGRGAASAEGFRWNSLGTSLAYSAESRSLAILEVAVHLDLSEDLPSDRYFVEIDIPDEVSILEVSLQDLPENWDNNPPRETTQFIGDDFVKSMEAAVLKVPSCIIPEEYNYLLNPDHPDAGRFKIIGTKPVRFDKRLQP